MHRELNGEANGVQDSTQDKLPRRPHCITLLNLLERGRLLMVLAVLLIQRPKDLCQYVYHNTFDTSPVRQVALDHADKDAHVDVPCLDRRPRASMRGGLGGKWRGWKSGRQAGCKFRHGALGCRYDVEVMGSYGRQCLEFLIGQVGHSLCGGSKQRGGHPAHGEH
jgi:hypothetical protein